jgi:hypothetical protein
MWMIVAPRFLASTTHWKATGWASAIFDPCRTIRSEFCRSPGSVLDAPRPNEVPRPTTVELWQTRAWFSTWITPSPVSSFLIR